jgi:DNA adenine methylase
MVINKSPLRYPGGKTRACKTLDTIVASNFDTTNINTVISPFFGGGSFEFFLQGKYNLKIIANDKFNPLATFWKICSDSNHRNTLCTKLYTKVEIVTKDEFLNFRTCIMTETDSIMQAYYYFIINRCSFSGATLSGGFSNESAKKRFTKSSVDRVKKLDLALDKFEMHNKDFTNFIETNCTCNKNELVFLDPPYYLEKKSKLYGKNGDMHEEFDHRGLYDILNKKKNLQWIMTYNDCKYIRDLYKNYTIIKIDWKYGMNKTKESSEIAIVKYFFEIKN